MTNFKIGETAVGGPFESCDSKTTGNWSISVEPGERRRLSISFTKVDDIVLPGSIDLSTTDANSWSFYFGYTVSLDVVYSILEKTKIFVEDWNKKFPGQLKLK